MKKSSSFSRNLTERTKLHQFLTNQD